jgi:endonuclease III
MAEATADQKQRTVTDLLKRFGRTYAEQAEITLADKPAPLYQLLVLTTMLSHRISADLAVQGAKALFASGYRTPERMREAGWQDRVDALGRGHFRRYDESTATTLGEVATTVIERWDGDLRKLRDAADADPGRIRHLLMEFKGIGPTGADIFLREVQAVWPRVSPYLDSKVSAGAALLDLPTDAHHLADLVSSPAQVARLASALVRVALEPDSAREIQASD